MARRAALCVGGLRGRRGQRTVVVATYWVNAWRARERRSAGGRVDHGDNVRNGDIRSG